MNTRQKRVITFGTFDVFHIGHVNILERAKELGDYLIVGVSSDELNFAKKGRYPIYRQEHRLQILNSIHCVNEVFIEESLEKKGEYLRAYRADVLVMGDDWAGKFDMFRNICEVVYLPRTKDISTTDIIQMIQRRID
jgi:glycerol-3-phosphate cytidylyltransferase